MTENVPPQSIPRKEMWRLGLWILFLSLIHILTLPTKRIV